MDAGDERAQKPSHGFGMLFNVPVGGAYGLVLIGKSEIDHVSENVVAHFLGGDIEGRRNQSHLDAAAGETREACILIAPPVGSSSHLSRSLSRSVPERSAWPNPRSSQIY